MHWYWRIVDVLLLGVVSAMLVVAFGEELPLAFITDQSLHDWIGQHLEIIGSLALCMIPIMGYYGLRVWFADPLPPNRWLF